MLDSPDCSPIRSRRPSSFSGLLVDRLGHLGLLDLRAVLLGDRGVVLAQLLADRVHLLAQEVLALLLLGALLDVLADALAHLQLGQALALELDRQLEALGDVERPQQLDLLLVGEVGGVAGRVGQRAGLADRAQERGDAPVVAAQLEDLLDHGAVLALELARAPVDGDLVGALVDLDAQLAVGAGLGRADQRAVLAREGDGVAAAGQADLLGDLGDRADLDELALVARDEHDALVVADVDRQRDAHVREHDGVVEWDQPQPGLGLVLSGGAEPCGEAGVMGTRSISTYESVVSIARGSCVRKYFGSVPKSRIAEPKSTYRRPGARS